MKITKEDFAQGEWISLPIEYYEPERYLFTSTKKQHWYTKLIDWVKGLFTK